MTANSIPSTDAQPPVAPREAWDAIADGYDRYVAPGEARLAQEALKLAGLKPGDRFLDVAAGPGGLSLPAARLGAQVVATDWSPAMIERFEVRVREEGITGAEGKVMDCHALEFEDDSFDITGSLFGVMLVPDQGVALQEMVRVTKPGGRVLMIAYGFPQEVEFLGVFISALQAVVPGFTGLPADPPPLEFQSSDPEVFRQRLTAAGLRDVQIDETAEQLEFHTGQEMWDWVLGSNPITTMITADLTDDQRATIKQVLHGMLRERAEGGAKAVLRNKVHIGIGTKRPG